MNNRKSAFRRNINKSEFAYLYLNTDMSIRELQQYYNVDQSTIYNRIKLWGLLRSSQQKELAKANSRKRCMLSRYGDEKFNITQSHATMLRRYGVENISQIKETRIKTAETKLRKYGSATYNNIEQTCKTKLMRYGNSYYSNRNQYKQTCLKKYGVDNTFKSNLLNKNPKEKEYVTCRANNTLNGSRIENDVYNILIPKYPHIQRQYKIQNMWFDFKIDNLLIELNGEFHHNYRPFNDTVEHISEYNRLINKSRFYKNIANTWRYRDTRKVKYCQDENLNLLVIYFNKFPSNILEIIESFNDGINIIQLNDNWVQRLSKV